MKTIPRICLLLFLVAAAVAQESTQIPKGIQAAQQAQADIEKSIPAPQIAARKPEDLQRDADQLAMLAQTVPADIAKIRQGMLPKDVVQKLKQIEKLSKRLRSQLNP